MQLKKYLIHDSKHEIQNNYTIRRLKKYLIHDSKHEIQNNYTIIGD